MNIQVIRSDSIYNKMMSASDTEKEDIFRDELLKPLEYKWQCIGAPLKAKEPGGYDAVMVTVMGGGYDPKDITVAQKDEIEQISNEFFWNSCEKSIKDTLEAFISHGIVPYVQDYVFTVLLNNPASPMAKMAGDYCGDGGIPGYILGTIIPNETSLSMLPVALVHETNHNVRWQYEKWSNHITLADMIVSEGLAENHAACIYGEEKVGKWVKDTSRETLQKVVKPMIKEHLDETDFQKVSAYLYGDSIMSMRGGTPIGMPNCGGYACGYALIKEYLQKTGKSIYEATIMSTKDIMEEMNGFWNEDQ